MPHTFCAHIVQQWNGDTKLSEVGPLSIDAARHVAESLSGIVGHRCHLLCAEQNYCAIYEDGQLVAVVRREDPPLVIGS